MKSLYAVQMWEESWYLDKFTQHECCLCGAQHDVKYLVERGRIYTNWKLDAKASAANRKRYGITLTRKNPATRRNSRVTGAKKR